MREFPDYEQAQRIVLEPAAPVGAERVPLAMCGGRILAQTLLAQENVPAFDRSAYDGFALRAADTQGASEDAPVTLQILEEIPAGAVPAKALTAGTAAKILTGAPIPPGADTVVMYEKTTFTAEAVTLRFPLRAGQNLVHAGEDVKKGALLAQSGSVIDPGLAGALAAQGVAEPLVYRRPRIALLSTGSELVEADAAPAAGKIRNSSRAALEAALHALGCETVYLGIAGDSAEEIAARIDRGLSECDALITTGGVSAGDYDLTPEAMTRAGAALLLRGVDMKPGMACAYGVRGGKLICALSGNPAAALTNFYVVALPALKKLMGCRAYRPEEITLTLASAFPKKSPRTRFLRGRLLLADGQVKLAPAAGQGNVQLSTLAGCNAMAMIPAGSGAVAAGAVLKGFLL